MTIEQGALAFVCGFVSGFICNLLQMYVHKREREHDRRK